MLGAWGGEVFGRDEAAWRSAGSLERPRSGWMHARAVESWERGRGRYGGLRGICHGHYFVVKGTLKGREDLCAWGKSGRLGGAKSSFVSRSVSDSAEHPNPITGNQS